jgi:small subunit ribosomal protein S9
MSEEVIATGRRKTAVAQIRMIPGSGQIEVNGKPFEEYFPTVTLQNRMLQPLAVTNCVHAFDVKIKAHGGGIVGQVGAVRLALARALVQTNGELKLPLRAEGLLTRDPRAKERKKSGQPGARKRFQFSKR